ncbi:hypothetical protein ACF0H5_019459 [Mactra antiquata]
MGADESGIIPQEVNPQEDMRDSEHSLNHEEIASSIVFSQNREVKFEFYRHEEGKKLIQSIRLMDNNDTMLENSNLCPQGKRLPSCEINLADYLSKDGQTSLSGININISDRGELTMKINVK